MGVGVPGQRKPFPQPGEGDEADGGDTQTYGGGGQGGSQFLGSSASISQIPPGLSRAGTTLSEA